MSRPHRRFSSEFKQEAVALVRRSGQSANRVAHELGIGQTSLSRWAAAGGSFLHRANGFEATEDVTALRREVERLRMERDILKKAAVSSMSERNTCHEIARQVHAFRKVLTQQAVCIFIGPPLPGALRALPGATAEPVLFETGAVELARFQHACRNNCRLNHPHRRLEGMGTERAHPEFIGLVAKERCGGGYRLPASVPAGDGR